MPRPPAIVIGLDSLPGLQTARLLSRHHIPVIGIASRADHYCCRTNACTQIQIADTQSGAVVDLLERLGRSFPQRPVLYPCIDRTVLLLSRHRDRLAAHYHLALPDHDVLERLMDKVAFDAFARAHGFRVPDTWVIRTCEDVEKMLQELTFPCILKPTKRTLAWNLAGRPKVVRLHTRVDLMREIEAGLPHVEALIVQAWIEGPDDHLTSCNLYVDQTGQPVATFVARKLRQWPPEAGISCLGEECRDDHVLHAAQRLFGLVNYHGLGYIEMKKDARTGEYFLLEANIGRATVRSAIAEAGGVEMLYAMYCDCLGLPLPAPLAQTYRGVKWIHLHYDLRSAWHYWRRGDLTLAEWWHSLRGRKAFALLSWRDPLPFCADILETLRRAWH